MPEAVKPTRLIAAGQLKRGVRARIGSMSRVTDCELVSRGRRTGVKLNLPSGTVLNGLDKGDFPELASTWSSGTTGMARVFIPKAIEIGVYGLHDRREHVIIISAIGLEVTK